MSQIYHIYFFSIKIFDLNDRTFPLNFHILTASAFSIISYSVSLLIFVALFKIAVGLIASHKVNSRHV
jgi:hypothetical protein